MIMVGKIVLVPFPFTDLTAAKLRPALVLYEGKSDVVLSFITSKVPVKPSDLDITLLSGSRGFAESGLKGDSVIKLNKIATVLKELVIGELGELDDAHRREVKAKLAKMFDTL